MALVGLFPTGLHYVRGSFSHAEGFNGDADDVSNNGSKGHDEDNGTHRSAEDSRFVM
jgi:hypothetical protein